MLAVVDALSNVDGLTELNKQVSLSLSDHLALQIMFTGLVQRGVSLSSLT